MSEHPVSRTLWLIFAMVVGAWIARQLPREAPAGVSGNLTLVSWYQEPRTSSVVRVYCDTVTSDRVYVYVGESIAVVPRGCSEGAR